jgi:hypothetical protein
MSAWLRRSVWLGRFVLGAAALLMTRIGLGYVLSPVGEAAPHGITLATPEAVTIMRVEGGLFLGIAVVLATCVLSGRRLLAGLGFLATLIGAITAARLLGLAVDGPAPFTVHVLAPELVLVVLSTVAFLLERRRLGGNGGGAAVIDTKGRTA